MGEVIAVRPADLLVDAENPRLAEPNVGQRDALHAIARNQKRKLLALAEDIVRHGVNPADLSIVTLTPADGSNRYTVLEGNRRLAAIRALENPDSFIGAIEPATLKSIRTLSREYQRAPVDSLTCYSVAARDEANHWIELRHTGENRGAGLVPWGSDESARYRHRSGRKREIHSQALDFLEDNGFIDADDRSRVPATSFKRLLNTPEVRDKLGMEFEDGEMRLLASQAKVGNALRHVAIDLADGATKVGDIYTKAQRITYAASLPKSIVVTPTRKPGKGRATTRKKSSKKKTTRARRRRADHLVPSDCILSVSDSRAEDIERELRRLSLEQYPNAVAVLFRVFIELTVDCYIENNKLMPQRDRKSRKLRVKMNTVLSHLLADDKLTRQQASPVRRALSRDSFLLPSVDLMHDYVHNPHTFPAPSDLRAHWKSLQPYIMAIWSA